MYLVYNHKMVVNNYHLLAYLEVQTDKQRNPLNWSYRRRAPKLVCAKHTDSDGLLPLSLGSSLSAIFPVHDLRPTLRAEMACHPWLDLTSLSLNNSVLAGPKFPMDSP